MLLIEVEHVGDALLGRVRLPVKTEQPDFRLLGAGPVDKPQEVLAERPKVVLLACAAQVAGRPVGLSRAGVVGQAGTVDEPVDERLTDEVRGAFVGR